MLHLILGLSSLFGTTTLTAFTPIDESLQQITPRQEIYLARLMNCESSGSSTVQIIDSNDEFSTGAFQYQFKTWFDQSKKYGLNYSKEDIYDYYKQKLLTHYILTDGGENNWFNCTRSLGDYPH